MVLLFGRSTTHSWIQAQNGRRSRGSSNSSYSIWNAINEDGAADDLWRKNGENQQILMIGYDDDADVDVDDAILLGWGGSSYKTAIRQTKYIYLCIVWVTNVWIFLCKFVHFKVFIYFCHSATSVSTANNDAGYEVFRQRKCVETTEYNSLPPTQRLLRVQNDEKKLPRP